MTAINTTTGASPFSLSNERQKQMIPNDVLAGLMPRTVHKDDRPDYVLSLEREVERLRNGIISDALRGRLAYQIRMHSNILTMTVARRIVDAALADALKGSTP